VCPIAAFLSLLISRGISRPIVRMQRIAQLFARGQLNAQVPGTGAAELDDLARALNEMATQLQDRIATITKQRNELEAVLSSMTEGVFAVDSQGLPASAAARLLNIDPARAQPHGRGHSRCRAGGSGDTLGSDEPTEAVISPARQSVSSRVRGGLSDPRGSGPAVMVLSDIIESTAENLP
jgi:HAMP domain-containing protein